MHADFRTPDQQFQRTVARAAAHAHDRGIEHIGADDQRLMPFLNPRHTLQDLVGEDMPETAALVWADDFFANAIAAGEADVFIAGGMENMSQVPMALPKARWGHRMELTGTGDIYDLMVFDGLYEIFYGYHMGMTAENIASLYGISRQEQDELGVLSHSRAMAAIDRAG